MDSAIDIVWLRKRSGLNRCGSSNLSGFEWIAHMLHITSIVVINISSLSVSFLVDVTHQSSLLGGSIPHSSHLSREIDEARITCGTPGLTLFEPMWDCDWKRWSPSQDFLDYCFAARSSATSTEGLSTLTCSYEWHLLLVSPFG